MEPISLAAPAMTTGSFTVSGQSIACRVESMPAVSVSMYVPSAVSGLNFTFEGSLDAGEDYAGNWDGSTGKWETLQAQRTNANTVETTSGSLSADPAYGWTVPSVGHKFVRVRATALTSGAATIYMRPGPAAVFPSSTTTTATLGAGTAAVGLVYETVSATVATGPTLLVSRLASAAASTNATLVKSSAGRLMHISGYNAATSARYLRFSNLTTTPVPGTSAAYLAFALAPSAAFNIDFTAKGMNFSTGIGYWLSGGAADTDVTALTAADVVGLNIIYI